jgi:hypothetical protein
MIKTDPNIAFQKFRLRKACDISMNTKKNGINTNTGENDDDHWAFQTLRTYDIIAQQRTDVAGTMRKRPSNFIFITIK